MDYSEMFQWISYGDREYLDDYLLQYDVKISILAKSILKAPEMEAEVMSVIHEIAYEGISSHQVLESEFPFWIIHETKTIATVYRNIMSSQDLSIPFVTPVSAASFLQRNTSSACNPEACPYLRDRDALAKKKASVTILDELSSVTDQISSDITASTQIQASSDSAKSGQNQASSDYANPLFDSAPSKPVEMSVEKLMKESIAEKSIAEKSIVEKSIVEESIAEESSSQNEGIYSSRYHFDYDYTKPGRKPQKNKGIVRNKSTVGNNDAAENYDAPENNEVPRVSTIVAQAISKESGLLEEHAAAGKRKFKLRLAPILVGILIVVVIALLIWVVYSLLNAVGIISMQDFKLSCLYLYKKTYVNFSHLVTNRLEILIERTDLYHTSK